MEQSQTHSAAHAAWTRVAGGLLAAALVSSALFTAVPAAGESAWQDVATGLKGNGGPIALDHGRPRLIYGEGKGSLHYGWCDTRCHEASSWDSVQLRGGTSLAALDIAIDPWGRPRIAYLDEARSGVFYAACDTDCGQAGAWSHAKVDSTNDDDGLSMALDPWGRPRLAYVSFGATRDLRFAACDDACTQASNWLTVTLKEAGGGVPSLDLDGRKPRIAYQKATPPSGDQLRYFACDSGCLQRSRWVETTVSSFDDFGNPSLVVEGGRAHVAFNPVGRATYLGYLRCERACSEASNWSNPAVVAAQHVVEPSLAVVEGRPRIAYMECVHCLSAAQQTYLGYAVCDTDCTSTTRWNAERLAGDALDPGIALDGEQPRLTYNRGPHDEYVNPLHYVSCGSLCGETGTWPPPPSDPPPSESPSSSGSPSGPDEETGTATSDSGEPDGVDAGSSAGGASGQGSFGDDDTAANASGSNSATAANGNEGVAAAPPSGRPDGDQQATRPSQRREGIRGRVDDLSELPGAALNVVTNPTEVLSWPWGRILLKGLAIALFGLVAWLEWCELRVRRRPWTP